ncbi:MAG: tRNA CCA-pyrophosphorylase [Deltaproteobacteria bacterium]|nr:MAG: tRNA CCA-pyrophosphorylase [Deltaproteobacteria bacterium]
MIDPKEYLKAGQQLHGHKCPAMPLGLRAGAAAMNKLGVERAKDSQLLAFVELGEGHCAHCYADGIQMITGCTFGKGNIKQLGYGKFGLTLVEKATGRAVRVVPRAEVQGATKQTPFFKNYREKGIPASEVPEEVVQPLIDQVMNMPEEKLLKISDVFQYELEPQHESFASFVCDRCGDMVVEKYGRVFGDRHVCIPCQEELLAGAED